jgi:hypothetical protein
VEDIPGLIFQMLLVIAPNETIIPSKFSLENINDIIVKEAIIESGYKI